MREMSCLPFPTPVSTGSGSKGLISGRYGHPQASCCGGNRIRWGAGGHERVLFAWHDEERRWFGKVATRSAS